MSAAIYAAATIMLAPACVTGAQASPQTGFYLPTPRPTPLHGQGSKSSPFASPGPTGAAVEGISLALQPQVAPYHIGRPMYFGLYTVNGTRKQLTYRSRTELRFEVAGGSGGAVRHQSYPLHRFDSAGVYNREVGIPIGSSSASASDLSETYDITEPGMYQVRAILTLHGSRATIASPWITITVVPKDR